MISIIKIEPDWDKPGDKQSTLKVFYSVNHTVNGVTWIYGEAVKGINEIVNKAVNDYLLGQGIDHRDIKSSDSTS